MKLSHSRMPATIWSAHKDQLSWITVHNEAFRRIKGVPATVRVDNVKTAVARGAGPWGELTVSYRRYAKALRFTKARLNATFSIIRALTICADASGIELAVAPGACR